MNKKRFLQTSLILAISITLSSTQAAVFSFQYTDTISSASMVGLSVGDPIKITVSLDNGGITKTSQTWTAANLKSVTFNFNNGTLLTTFNAPFGGSIDTTNGNFVTDASGTLTSVMVNWNDSAVGTDFTTNGVAPSWWYLFGANSMYGDGINTENLTNVSNMLNPASWLSVTIPAAVPAPIDPMGSHKPINFTKDVKIK